MSEINRFPASKAEYAAARAQLYERIATFLEADSRFTAAWLAGSFGRGEQDEYSDLDIFVVVDPEYAAELCSHPQMKNAGSLPARLALFTSFGEPANLHENHHNAPEGGSFSAVMYTNPPVIVDWTLLPLAVALRPVDTRLLFDRVGIPIDQPAVEDPLLPEDRAALLSERTAFFWMMAAITAKYVQRDEANAVHQMFAHLNNTVEEIEQLLAREALLPANQVYPTQAEQKAYLLLLCEQVEALGLPAAPRAQVEAIINLDA
jgi:predicted nucleotidyltransferase